MQNQSKKDLKSEFQISKYDNIEIKKKTIKN